MMNVPPSEADKLDLYTYEAMLWHWNEAHASDHDGGDLETIDAPRAEWTMKAIDRINSDPRLTH